MGAGVGSLEEESSGDEDEGEKEQWNRGKQHQIDCDEGNAHDEQHQRDDQEVALQQRHRQLAARPGPRIRRRAHGIAGEYLPSVWLLLNRLL